MKILFSLLFVISFTSSFAQHIQYRDKKKPVANKTDGGSGSTPIPVPDNTVKVTPPKPVVVEEKKIIPKDTIEKPVAIKEDTSQSFTKTKTAFTMNSRPKKPYVEEQNYCDLLSRPELAPQLPIVINNVTPEMVKMLKERYKGRLYSITGLNMFDQRLKYKLKICDKNNGKFRSEYLDKDGNVVTDPDFDYN
ncbi:MAG: hypothetical protein JWN78_88 [Bacteroidota bacterium]|nr:hypothetical protein [Bacteroidota bacterium]